MSVLKTRGGAVLVLLVVIVLSTMYGVNRSLGGQVRAIESGCFHDSLVAANVEENKKSSMDLIYVADSYPELAEEKAALQAARNDLANAWDEKTDAEAVTAANQALTTAAESLYEAMQKLALSADDAEYASNDIDTIRNATRVLKSGTTYNQAAQAFNSETMRAFPTNYLKYAGFVEEAALF
jgi:hypothetical protein